MRGLLLAAAAAALLVLAGCSAPAPTPVSSPAASVAPAPEAAAGDLVIACNEFPEAYLTLQTTAINAETFAEVSVQSGLTRLALEAAVDTTLTDASFEPFVAEQFAFLDTVDAAALAEDRIALLTAVQEGPSFIEPLTETCAGQPGW